MALSISFQFSFQKEVVLNLVEYFIRNGKLDFGGQFMKYKAVVDFIDSKKEIQVSIEGLRDYLSSIDFDSIRLVSILYKEREYSLKLVRLFSAKKSVFRLNFEMNNTIYINQLLDYKFPYFTLTAHECIYFTLNSTVSAELMLWSFHDKDLPKGAVIVKKQYAIDPDEKELLLESLPGHVHFVPIVQRQFIVTALMKFSPEYYQYMPKYLFDKYDGGFRNEIDEQGYRTIQLYQDIGKFPGEYERAKQWHFRRSIGMESIVHELMEVPNDFCPELQPVKISKKEVKHGSIRVEEFVDNHGRHTIPLKASKLLIKEFDDSGLTCVFEEERMLKKKWGFF